MFRTVDISIGGMDPFSFEFSDADHTDSVALDVARNGLVYYEIPLPTVLGALAKSSGGDFLDIGANTGIYTLLAAAANPAIKVYSFEPIPSIMNLLKLNVKQNPSLENCISLEPIALSNKDGVLQISEHLNPVGLVATSSTLETRLTTTMDHLLRDVEVRQLDSWTHENTRAKPSLLKVDVEGHEMAFFQGALSTISKFRPFIALELLGPADFKYFNAFKRDYRYVDIALYPGLAKLESETKFIPEAWNHLFCPEEHAWKFASICNQIGLPIA